MDSGNTLSERKDFSPVKIRKKIHRISDKSLIVIDEGLVKQLYIGEDTWCEQELVPDGILLRLFRYVQGEQLSKPSLSRGGED